MVDIQSATAEISPGKKERKKEKEKERQKQDKNIMSASATQGGHNKMVFSAEDLVLIKVLRQEKGYDN